MSLLVAGQKCPKCGSELMDGYGLMFGGIGYYQYCTKEECDWHVKDQDPQDPENVPKPEGA